MSVEAVETVEFMEACRRIAGAGIDPVEFFAGKEFATADRFIVKHEGREVTLYKVSEMRSYINNN
ncbi:hypothetical protein [Klebsiella variicola]|uniref:hypothetical protein n=1 Tax=Klebsiella variicola TaxID=244366 RepID=UPI002405D895|nr:hypothetical protein [Klebsiella variicola]MDG0490088.1 hypothetical protein [Klebsiella variicola]